MDPRPPQSGGSVSANAGAELAALISARGTSVWARRSIIFGGTLAAAAPQIGMSGLANDSASSAAADLPSAKVAMLLASKVANAVPASAAAAADTSSLCDCVDVVMSYSSNRAQTEPELPNARSEIGTRLRLFRPFCKTPEWVSAAAQCPRSARLLSFVSILW